MMRSASCARWPWDRFNTELAQLARNETKVNLLAKPDFPNCCIGDCLSEIESKVAKESGNCINVPSFSAK